MGLSVILQNWRTWIRPVFFVSYILTVLIFIPIFLTYRLKNHEFSKSQETEAIVAGIFVLFAIPISIWEIIQHVIHYRQPNLQKYVIRILWMVPIYALNSWIGLVFPNRAIILDCLRECYEAYVIYNFMMFLLTYLNMEMNLEASLELRPQVKHFFPLCCLTPWEMGSEFVSMCKHGILQYTVVRPVTTAISLVCELNGVYGEGEFRANVAYPYMVAINDLSQFVAMYCLVLFYKANVAELKPMKPLPKFLCIKAVVFFSFFQGVVINFLFYFGVLDSGDSNRQQISNRLQDFLICIEMCLAAIAHYYSFSYHQYDDSLNGTPPRSCSGTTSLVPSTSGTICRSFLATWDVSDFQNDVKEHLGVIGGTISRKLRGKNSYKRTRGTDDSLEAPQVGVDKTGSLNKGTVTYGSI